MVSHFILYQITLTCLLTTLLFLFWSNPAKPPKVSYLDHIHLMYIFLNYTTVISIKHSWIYGFVVVVVVVVVHIHKTCLILYNFPFDVWNF